MRPRALGVARSSHSLAAAVEDAQVLDLGEKTWIVDERLDFEGFVHRELLHVGFANLVPATSHPSPVGKHELAPAGVAGDLVVFGDVFHAQNAQVALEPPG